MCNWDRQLNANSEVSTFRRNNWKSVCQVWGQNANGKNTNRKNTKWFVGILSGPFFVIVFCLAQFSWYFVRTISTWFGILSGSSVKHDLVFCPNHQNTFIIITATSVIILILVLILKERSWHAHELPLIGDVIFLVKESGMPAATMPWGKSSKLKIRLNWHLRWGCLFWDLWSTDIETGALSIYTWFYQDEDENEDEDDGSGGNNDKSNFNDSDKIPNHIRMIRTKCKKKLSQTK